MNLVIKAFVLGLVTLTTTACIVVNADVIDFETQQTLTLSAEQIDRVEIEATAGSLTLIGEAGRTLIEVEAELMVEREYYRLTLEKQGATAVLVADANTRNFSSWNGQSPRINLVVKAPAHLLLDINDGSGDTYIRDFSSDMSVKDGSGYLEIKNISGDLKVIDGSGSLEISYVKGNVNIKDGSGSIEIRQLDKNLQLDDGSGSVFISVVGGDVEVDDGSGELTIEKVVGHVTVDDGSGNINLDDIGGGLTLLDTGSGGLHMRDVRGAVSKD